MPSGGDGFYYFSLFLTAHGSEIVYFNVNHNGEEISTVFSDPTSSASGDQEMASCSVIIYAVEGTLILLIKKKKSIFS